MKQIIINALVVKNVVLYDRFQDITLFTKNKHCPKCGQRLDWS